MPAKKRRTSASAKGTKYESQGQAWSEAKRVAPGLEAHGRQGLNGRNNNGITPFQGSNG